MLVPFGEWAPDTPDLGPDAVLIKGCIPRTAVSYGPFNSLATNSNALDARCQGFAGFIDSSNNANVFAASNDKIYKLSSLTFSDVSIGGGYAHGSEAVIQFVQHSTGTNDRIIACGDINTDIQVYTLGSSALFAQLSATAPRARCIALFHSPMGGIPVVGNTWDATDGYRQNRIWWPDLTNNDPTNWPVPGSAAAQAAQSDFRNLGFGGPVMALGGPIGGAAHGIVICRRAIYRAIYSGSASVYDFFAMSYSVGTSCKNGVIQVRDRLYWIGDDDFYFTDGAGIYPLGAGKVARYFWARVDQSNLHRVCAACDPIKKMIYFAAPDGSNASGNPAFVIGFNYEISRWSLPQDAVNIEIIGNSLSLGVDADSLGSLGSADALNVDADSAQWSGGRPLIAGFDSSHKYGAFDGTVAAVTIDSGDVMGEDGQRNTLQGFRPIVEGSGLDSSTLTMAAGYKDTPYSSPTYDTATAIGVNGICPARRDARFLRARLQIAAGANWEHIVGVEPVYVQSGKR